MVVHRHKLGEMDNECTSNSFCRFGYSVCQKLSNLVKIWRSSDKNNLGHFVGPSCVLLLKS